MCVCVCRLCVSLINAPRRMEICQDIPSWRGAGMCHSLKEICQKGADITVQWDRLQSCNFLCNLPIERDQGFFFFLFLQPSTLFLPCFLPSLLADFLCTRRFLQVFPTISLFVFLFFCTWPAEILQPCEKKMCPEPEGAARWIVVCASGRRRSAPPALPYP